MIEAYLILAFCLIAERKCTFLEDLKAAATVCTEKFPIPIEELASLQSLILSKAYLPPKYLQNKRRDFTLEKCPRIEDYFDGECSDKINHSPDKGKGLVRAEEPFDDLLGKERRNLVDMSNKIRNLINSNSRLISKINSNEKSHTKPIKHGTNLLNENDINPAAGTSSDNKSDEIKKSEIIEEVEDTRSVVVTGENIEDEITKWRNTDSSHPSYDSFSPFSDGLERIELDKPYSVLHDNDIVKSIYKKSAQYRKAVKNIFLTTILDFCLIGSKKNFDPDLTYEVSNYSQSTEDFTISESPDTSIHFVPEERRLLAVSLVARYLYECLFNYDDREKKVALQLNKLTPRGSLAAWVEYYLKNHGKAGNLLEKKYKKERAREMGPNAEDSQEELSYVCKVSLKDFFSDSIHYAKSSIFVEPTKNIGICQLFFKTEELVILTIEKSFTPPTGFFISVLRSTQPKVIVEFVQLSDEKHLLIGN